MGVLPTFRESSPSSKLLQAQDSTIWWPNACPWHVGTLLYSFIAQQCSVLASFSFTMLFIAGAEPWEVGEVMTLSPRGSGTCRHVHD
jgi:hypothetical protein